MLTQARGLTGIAFAGALLAATAAQAVPTVVVDLGPPMIVGNQAQMEVKINFTDPDDPSTVLTAAQIDVSNSDASLTTPDFFRFSFTPDAAISTPDWLEFIGFPSDSVVAYQSLDPSLANLAIGMHTLGTLNVNLSGLAPGSQHVVDIGNFDVDGTFFFYFDGQLEDFVPVVTGNTAQTITVPRVTQPAIPEPATLALGGMAMAGLAVRRRRA